MTDPTDSTPETEASDTQDKAPSPAPVQVVAHRPWLGPAIASGVILLVIVILLIPNVLLYPQDRVVASPQIRPETFDQARSSLEQRAEELRGMLALGVCIADGEYTFTDPELAELNGVTPEQLERATLPALQPPPPRPDPEVDPETGEPVAPPSQEGTLQDLLNSSVALILTNTSSGSGFFISDRLVVTNGHVVGDDTSQDVIVVNSALGAPVRARILSTTGEPTARDPDFALLELEAPNPNVTPMELAATPETLTPVIAAGYPGFLLRNDAAFQALIGGDLDSVPALINWPGDIIALQDVQDGSLLIHSSQITPGNSGGPLVDYCGRVLGVNTFVVQESQTGGRTNNALNSAVLRTWLMAQGVTLNISTTSCSPDAALPFSTRP